MAPAHAGFNAAVDLVRDGIPFVQDEQQVRGVLPGKLGLPLRIAPGALGQLRQVMGNPRVAGGSFTLVFDVDNFWLRFYAFCSTVDCLCFRYGDQGIFVRRAIFGELGGYAEIPLMEDIDLMRRLPRYGRRVLIRNCPVTTSARRFMEHGILRQEALNVALVTAWFLGIKPHTLAKWYAAHK